MSNDTPSSSTPDDASSPDAANGEAETDSSAGPSRKELQERVDELRAQLARLEAQQANARSRTTGVQRHPWLTVLLASGAGAALGYSASQVFHSRAPSSLSEQARRRLQQLSEEAAQRAAQTGKEWSDRALREGQDVGQRAAEAGRRLAQEARKGAQSATKRAREAGEEATESLREATGEASRQLRDAAESAADETQSAVQKRLQSDPDASESAGSSVGRLFFTLGGLAVAGYLASKLS